MDWKTQYCQVYMERQNTPIVKRHEKKKNKVVEVILPDLKTYYKAIIIKIAWHLWNNRHIDKWNKIESTEINPYTYNHLIFSSGAKAVQCTKDSLSTNGAGAIRFFYARKILDTDFIYFTNWFNLKWIMDLSVECKIIKLLEGNLENLGNLCLVMCS